MQKNVATLAIVSLLALACSSSQKFYPGASQASTDVGVAGNGGASVASGGSAVTGGRSGTGGATSSSGGAAGSGDGTGGKAILLLNGDFEQGSGDLPAVWQTGAWDTTRAAFHWVTGAGRNGSHAGVIESSTTNDAFFMQKGIGNPFRVYKLGGYIKGEGLSDGAGATIGLPGWGPSVGGTGTFDWTLFQMPVATIADGSFEVWVRIGGYSNTTSGKAFFDDLTLVEDNSYVSWVGKHVAFMLLAADTAGISDAHFSSWLNHLDSVYETYAELVGAVPSNGDAMGVFALSGISAWAYAGFPIQWNRDYVSDTLKSINDNDDWCFGIMHEMGHNLLTGTSHRDHFQS